MPLRVMGDFDELLNATELVSVSAETFLYFIRELLSNINKQIERI